LKKKVGIAKVAKQPVGKAGKAGKKVVAIKTKAGKVGAKAKAVVAKTTGKKSGKKGGAAVAVAKGKGKKEQKKTAADMNNDMESYWSKTPVGLDRQMDVCGSLYGILLCSRILLDLTSAVA
jgi:hypothetical protein